MKTDTVRSQIDYSAMRNPIARFRIRVTIAIGRNPLWRLLNRLCEPFALPFCWFANYALAKIPALERLEWMLAIRSLANRAPVLVLISAALCVIRGFRVTQFGHIGTDRAIYPLITLISSFNPFLAICCATLFGVADLVQKLFFVNDIYGAPNRLSLQFAGALMGYTIAYSALVMMGLAPGIASRLARKGLMRVLSRVGSADGASEKHYVPSLSEDIFAIAASTATAVLTMRNLVPDIEKPAFYFRPEADGSCYQLEVGELQATIPYAGLGAGVGTGLLDRPEGDVKLNQIYDENGDPIPTSDEKEKGLPPWVMVGNDLLQLGSAFHSIFKDESPEFDWAVVVNTVMNGVDEGLTSTAQTTPGKIADGVWTAWGTALTMFYDPLVALVDSNLSFLTDTGAVPWADTIGLQKNFISSPGRAVMTLAESMITNDAEGFNIAEGLNEFQAQSLSGKNGVLFYLAAGAGQATVDDPALSYWLENFYLGAAAAERGVLTNLGEIYQHGAWGGAFPTS